MSKVFVIDANKMPLEPVHPGRARYLLKTGKAVVWRRYPFCIMLKRAVEAPLVEGLRIKIDPGSRTTGLALVNDASGEVVWGAELVHRGHEVVTALQKRAAQRRGRRQRKTRYRQARFSNRRRKAGWLPPSLFSRLAQTRTWCHRLMKLCQITAISVETARFDTVVLSGKKRGRYVGRVRVRASGYFDLETASGRVTGIAVRFCSPLHRIDGYAYRFGKADAIPATPSTKQRRVIPPLAQAEGHPGPIL